ncbi:PDZ domain-containing protein [Gimesia aquarii]|uniref:Putative periplasmic serine endoprotease DegP-like n=1 Tax=Gimesia aquarii TaxID=2527964 RepID=A0A517X2N7_9PLAN|nr:PDZ domain-containing protein [Gimesia aquarii]QDU11766.1 putative periplasmic serine endoprotease DegP-like precursor [Gimesia aquarii]
MTQTITKLFLTLTTIISVQLQAVHGQSSQPDLELLEERAFKQAAAFMNPSIVRIETVGGQERVGKIVTGTGPTSGVIVSKDGLIISSAFNFIGKPTSILVTLPDERRFPAQIVASDHLKMLTLLKIEAQNLPVPLAVPENEIQVGMWSIALGRTFNLEQPSVSVGIVSALERIWGKAIQTDAKISPVNYGGPLVDINGRLMGILVPLSPGATGETAGVEWYDSGIGFAIPIQDVLKIIPRLNTGKDLYPGLLGITLSGKGNLSTDMKLDRVRYGSPAQEAGIKSGDVLTKLDGHTVSMHSQVKHVLMNKYAGESVSLTVTRTGSKEPLTLKATLVKKLVPFESGFLGILPQREFNDPSERGVRVRYVFSKSPAELAGLKLNDQILEFNRQKVTNSKSLASMVNHLRPGDSAELLLLREEQPLTVKVTLQSIPHTVENTLPSQIVSSKTALKNKPAFKKGHFKDTLPGDEQKFWAYVPEDYNPDNQYGLMVWIHPHGNTMESNILKSWKSICEQRGIIIVGPTAQDVIRWNRGESEFVKEVVESMLAQYSIDPKRIFLLSHTDGSDFAFHLVFKYREFFRGIAVSESSIKSKPPETDPDFPLSIYFVLNAQNPFNQFLKPQIEILRKMNYPTVFQMIKSKNQAGEYLDKPFLEEIGRWADSLDRI